MEMNITVELIDALHIISPEIYVLKHIGELTNIGKETYLMYCQSLYVLELMMTIDLYIHSKNSNLGKFSFFTAIRNVPLFGEYKNKRNLTHVMNSELVTCLDKLKHLHGTCELINVSK